MVEEKGKKPIVIQSNEGKKPLEINTKDMKTKDDIKTSGFVKNKKMNKLVFFIVIIILVLLLAFFLNSIKIVDTETIKDSVVMLKIYDKDNNEISTGSGFCAYKSNYIVTNFHVVEGAYKIKIVTDDNKEYSITKVEIFNKSEDLAILSGNFELETLKTGNTNNLKAGTNVTAIGSPKGQLNTVSTGIISNADNEYEIRITAPISPGSSGGVLLDAKNKVIGITFAIYNSEDSQNINYAISAKYLDKIYNDLKNKNYVSLTSSNILSKNYTVSSLETLYNNTNSKQLFENSLKNDWRNIYNSFENDEQLLIIDLYEKINSKAYSNHNISSWEVIDYLINLGILDKTECAIAVTDLYKNSNSENVFKIVNSYSIGTFEKAVILLLLGDFSPNDLNNDDANNVIKNINDMNYSIEEKTAILQFMGYRVEGENVYW